MFAVLTISTLAFGERRPEGDAAREAIEHAGHEVTEQEIVGDDREAIAETVESFVGDVDVVVTSGGTGLTPDDVTVEAVRPLLDKELPGVGEYFRRLSHEQVGTMAMLSRATAGVADDTAIYAFREPGRRRTRHRGGTAPRNRPRPGAVLTMTAVGERTAVADARAALLDLIRPVEERRNRCQSKWSTTGYWRPLSMPRERSRTTTGPRWTATPCGRRTSSTPASARPSGSHSTRATLRATNPAARDGSPRRHRRIDAGPRRRGRDGRTHRASRRRSPVFEAVAPGENVGLKGRTSKLVRGCSTPAIASRRPTWDSLRVVGVDAVEVYRRPRVVLIPTGEELVENDPDPGEVVESNSLTVARYVERWGGETERFDPVTDDSEALRTAPCESKRAGDADLILTLGAPRRANATGCPAPSKPLDPSNATASRSSPATPSASAWSGRHRSSCSPATPWAVSSPRRRWFAPQSAGWPTGRSPIRRPPRRRSLANSSSPVGTRTYARVALDGDVATPIRARGSGVLPASPKRTAGSSSRGDGGVP